MEAGGVEPPSRDISGHASTCLVVYQRFAPQTAKRQAICFAISLSFAVAAANAQQPLSRYRRPRETRRKKSHRTSRIYAASLHW